MAGLGGGLGRCSGLGLAVRQARMVSVEGTLEGTELEAAKGSGVVWGPASEAGAESGPGMGRRGTQGPAVRHAVLLPDDGP